MVKQTKQLAKPIAVSKCRHIFADKPEWRVSVEYDGKIVDEYPNSKKCLIGTDFVLGRDVFRSNPYMIGTFSALYREYVTIKPDIKIPKTKHIDFVNVNDDRNTTEISYVWSDNFFETAERRVRKFRKEILNQINQRAK
jgi:hypothetical protein